MIKETITSAQKSITKIETKSSEKNEDVEKKSKTIEELDREKLEKKFSKKEKKN